MQSHPYPNYWITCNLNCLIHLTSVSFTSLSATYGMLRLTAAKSVSLSSGLFQSLTAIGGNIITMDRNYQVTIENVTMAAVNASDTQAYSMIYVQTLNSGLVEVSEVAMYD